MCYTSLLYRNLSYRNEFLWNDFVYVQKNECLCTQCLQKKALKVLYSDKDMIYKQVTNDVMYFKVFLLHIFLIFYHLRCIAHYLYTVSNILGRLFWRICRTFRVQSVIQIFHQQKTVFYLKTYFSQCLACISEQAKCVLLLIRKLLCSMVFGTHWSRAIVEDIYA